MQTSTDQWFYPRGTLQRDRWETVVDSAIDGWSHTGLRVVELADGVPVVVDREAFERMIVPLSGGCTVEYEAPGESGVITLAGRASVFDGPSDVAYLPTGTSMILRGSGRIALAEAPTPVVHPVQVISREGIPVELRGAGRSSRQVHNFGTPGTPGTFVADKLIVCEVITPAENWSSYPPHKHDETLPGHESALEEIYYFESAVVRGATSGAAADPFGMFATYASPIAPIAINSLVRTGDVALVPFGYHGPAVAAPGYDLYYLNVMAGPGAERAWLISDDPQHAWIRPTWDGQEIDPRLPFDSQQKTQS